MSQLDKILSELAGAKLIAIVPENKQFYLKFNNGRETKLLTLSAEGHSQAHPTLSFKNIDIAQKD